MKNHRYSMGLASLAFLIALLGMAPPASAQSDTTTACTSDDNEKAMYYSLYYEDYKNKNFGGALENLKWILNCAPGYPRNDDRNFDRAVQTYEALALESEDPAMQRAMMDSALHIFDVTVPTLKDAGMEVDEFEWTFEQGRFIQEHQEILNDIQGEVGDLYRSAFAMDPSRLQAYYINYIIADYVQADDKQAAVDFMSDVETKMADNAEVITMITDWRGRLFTSPEERIGFLETQLEEKPDDPDIIAELFELYLDEGFRDKVYEMADLMMASAPSARTYRLVAKMRLEDGDTEDAISLYMQSLEMEGGIDSAREVHYNIGIAHQQEGRLSRARTSFREALKADPNFGAAIIAIGDLYATSVQGCGSFEREDRTVYWLVTDYYDRAASRDASVANVARQKTRNYRKYYPDQEALFFKNWTAGDAFQVNAANSGECYAWINESTTVKKP